MGASFFVSEHGSASPITCGALVESKDISSCWDERTAEEERISDALVCFTILRGDCLRRDLWSKCCSSSFSWVSFVGWRAINIR